MIYDRNEHMAAQRLTKLRNGDVDWWRSVDRYAYDWRWICGETDFGGQVDPGLLEHLPRSVTLEEARAEARRVGLPFEVLMSLYVPRENRALAPNREMDRLFEGDPQIHYRSCHFAGSGFPEELLRHRLYGCGRALRIWIEEGRSGCAIAEVQRLLSTHGWTAPVVGHIGLDTDELGAMAVVFYGWSFFALSQAPPLSLPGLPKEAIDFQPASPNPALEAERHKMIGHGYSLARMPKESLGETAPPEMYRGRSDKSSLEWAPSPKPRLIVRAQSQYDPDE